MRILFIELDSRKKNCLERQWVIQFHTISELVHMELNATPINHNVGHPKPRYQLYKLKDLNRRKRMKKKKKRKWGTQCMS